MPPKKTSAPSKKTETKKKEKVIEDKTFGLKNKKGSKQQKFIQQIEKQVKSGGHHPLNPIATKKDEKEKKLKEAKELAALFKPVQTQKLEKGTDPKSVVCAFFKAGQCGKGDKCKFSHDLSVENKVEKRSMYVDMRDGEEEGMENWDDQKLQDVVNTKHGSERRMPTTDIICKYFLEAVEKSKYGWFWECPNGEKCIYRHALPAGYVLKKDKKKMDENKIEISLVDLIERERAALGPKQTKVTLETFLAWKKRKIQDKKDKFTADEEKKKSDYKQGKQYGLSGREMFSFNPDLVDDGPIDDEGGELISYDRSDDEEESMFRELDLNELSLAAQEVDGSGTVASEDRNTQLRNGIDSASADAVPINENLFMDEDCLEGLDDELNDLDIEDD